MVLESFLQPKFAEKNPYLTLFYSSLASTFALFLSYYVMPTHSSLVVVFFITMMFIPLFYKTMIYEEKKDVILKDATEEQLLVEHSKALFFFLFIFIGTSVTLAFWYIVFSQTGNTEMLSVYSAQLQTIASINGKADSNIMLDTVDSLYAFALIFGNNVRVLFFCILFSFIFGAGAIFITVWNSTVIGAALGSYTMKLYSAMSGLAGIALLKASTCGILRYMIHGIPEMAGYFVGGLCGGILSAALITHDSNSEAFKKILYDSSTLLLVALVILVIAGLLEVGVTPMIMCRT